MVGLRPHVGMVGRPAAAWSGGADSGMTGWIAERIAGNYQVGIALGRPGDLSRPVAGRKTLQLALGSHSAVSVPWGRQTTEAIFVPFGACSEIQPL